MRHWNRAVAALLAGAWVSAAAAADGVKVVYHINAGMEQAVNGLRNIRNHLDADPDARIVVVTHSDGIDFLLDGAKDKNGNPFEVAVQGLQERKVEFRVCRKTLQSRKLPDSVVIPEASIVPSGVAEVARLQAKEGFVYLRP
ncbi:MAG: hypothetical protein EHM83_08580 [Burkholderiales bacterium]|nr:MAG: hypothetical protein EHM83_17580 [Burkholderiales bacterium]RPH64242.1 MAG: hypothetical protein EHM83_08580 [Burkholderiales bacterium]